jgi:hypothetical protein
MRCSTSCQHAVACVVQWLAEADVAGTSGVLLS